MDAMRAHALDGGAVLDPAFNHDPAIGRQVLGDIDRGLQIGLETAQFAIVDANEHCVQSLDTLQLTAILNLDEDIEPEPEPGRDQNAQQRIVQRGGDTQNTVRASGARFKYLVGIDNDILAQDWQGHTVRQQNLWAS